MARRKNMPITEPPTFEVIKAEVVEQPMTKLEKLLNDPVKLNQATEYAKLGASSSTIASRIGMPIAAFCKWMVEGKKKQEDDPGSPEARLFSIMADAWSNARTLAEASLAQRDPLTFLTRGPGRLLGDDWVEQVETVAVEEKDTLQVGTEFVDALKLLRQQGIDLNEIIDKDQLTLNTNAPKSKPAIENKATEVQVNNLPGELGAKATALQQILNLKFGKPNNNVLEE